VHEFGSSVPHGAMAFDVLRVLLAVVFAAAGVAKLRDVAAVSATLRELPGVREPVVRPLAGLLIGTELAVAVLLFAAPVAGLALGVALLLGFAALAAALARGGRQVRCACFGNVSDSVLGRSTVLRNLALAAVAVVALGLGSEPGVASAPAVLLGLALAAGAAMTSLCWAAARRPRDELERIAVENLR
jgi:methylamine utilization protein MauE